MNELNYNDEKAQAWIGSQVARISAEYKAEGATSEDIDLAAQNAEQCVKENSTAAEWVELFEASIFQEIDMYGLDEHVDHINGMDCESDNFSVGENPDYKGDPDEGDE